MTQLPPEPGMISGPVKRSAGAARARAGGGFVSASASSPGMVPGRLRSSRWSTLVLAVAGGLVTDLAFPHRSWWPMAYAGIALLILALRRDSTRWAALAGLLWGVGFFAPHLWWAQEATGSLLPWAALTLFQGSYVALFGAVWVWVRRGTWVRDRAWAQVAAVAVVWVAVEHLRGAFPFGGLPWGYLAFSQTDAPLLRLAALGGTPLVSGAVVALGALLALACQPVRRGRLGTAGIAVASGAVLLVGPWLVPLAVGAESGTLRVGAVQGNVPERGAQWFTQARQITANHARTTQEMLASHGEVDLVLWPESSADIDPRTAPQVAATVEAAAQGAGAPILLGTQRFPEGEDVRYNEMILWLPDQGSTAVYAKQHPVPFGEYVPYRDFFRQITPLVDLIGTDMAAGTRTAMMPVPVERLGRTVPVVTGICFEVAYDALIQQGVAAGGELIVIPTNNASFGHTRESTQQLAMSRFRAVEHGRATVQVSTVGVSGVISPGGVVLDRTALFTSDAMVETLPLRTSLTVATRLGPWPVVAAYALTVIALLTGVVTGRRVRTTPVVNEAVAGTVDGPSHREAAAVSAARAARSDRT